MGTVVEGGGWAVAQVGVVEMRAWAVAQAGLESGYTVVRAPLRLSRQ
jgi:hypothetical protein